MNRWSGVYQWSLLITAALIPSGLYELTLAFVGVSGLCWIMQKRYAGIAQLKQEPQFLFSILLYLYIAISACFSINHKEALSSVSVYFPLLFFPLFVGLSGIITTRLIRKIEIIFMISTIVSMLILLGYAFADSIISGVDRVRLNDGDYSKYSSFGLTRAFGNFHPTYFSLFVNHSIIIIFQVLPELYREKKTRLFGSAIVAVCFLILSLFLLNSMMGVLVFLLTLFYYSIVVLKNMGFSLRKRLLMVTGFLILASSFIYFNPLDLYKINTLKTRKLAPTDNYEERNLLTIRLAKWETHLMIVKRHFLFGTTEGDIKPIRKEAYLEKGYKDLALHNYNAHNQYLEVFTNYGLIGFIFLAGLLITPFFRKLPRNFYLFMIISLVTWLTESIWERQQGFNYFMFFFALYTAPLMADKALTGENNLRPV